MQSKIMNFNLSLSSSPSPKGQGEKDERKGSGTCACYKGYRGDLCDSCTLGYYMEEDQKSCRSKREREKLIFYY